MGDRETLPHRRHPCGNCPFRKDVLKGWLGNRIEGDLKSPSFVCHKNNDLQCAGHMLLLKEANIYYRLAKYRKIDLQLKGEHLIFDSREDCIRHHKTNKMIIATSDLGYSTTYYEVETDCSKKDLEIIDHTYGMQYRHQSTTIKQMKEGAEKEGFKFEYKEIPKPAGGREAAQYVCNYGNY